MKTLPDFSFEKELWQRGIDFVAGIDEVGRGCFAGPVVASAVALSANSTTKSGQVFQFPIFNKNKKKVIINDSKKLTLGQRENSAEWIKENALTWGVGVGSVALINKRGIKRATDFAFRSALKNAEVRLNRRVEYLLIDAFYIPFVRGLPVGRKITYRKGLTKKTVKFYGKQLAIKKGDQKSLSIAAASIIAKVYRDKLMVGLSRDLKFKKYGWDENKGYGTLLHRMAIETYGVTKLHRLQFVKKISGS